MLDSHRLTIKLSTLRSSLLDLSRKDAPTDEDRAAIVDFETQLGHTEAQLRAALLSEGDSTPSDGGENRALDRLVSRANLGSIFQCAVEQRAPGGPESELQQHFGVAINCVPLRLLEQRAVATVPASVSSTPAATGQFPTLLPIFSLGDTAYLGVSQIRAEPGSSSHPVLDTRPDIHGPFTDSIRRCRDHCDLLCKSPGTRPNFCRFFLPAHRQQSSSRAWRIHSGKLSPWGSQKPWIRRWWRRSSRT